MQQLHYKIFGDTGPTLIILHGLFGSLENWARQANTLSSHFRVIAIDLRNHGRSPHVDAMGYAAMAADVLRLLNHLDIDRAHVIGHSMGGKTAMQFALEYSSRVNRLVIVDIAPRAYPPHHDAIFDALDSIDLAQLGSRGQADKQISPAVSDVAVRSFLLKNLKREISGYSWKFNLPVLRDDYDQIAAAVQSELPFRGDTLFIKGGLSDYIQSADEGEITRLFPVARAKSIQNAGHWPHVEKAAVFAKIVGDFLLGGKAKD